MDEKLRECPFCGKRVACRGNSEECLDLCHQGLTVMHTVVCDFRRGGCGATCGFHETEAEAVYHWNIRAEDETQ